MSRKKVNTRNIFTVFSSIDSILNSLENLINKEEYQAVLDYIDYSMSSKVANANAYDLLQRIRGNIVDRMNYGTPNN
jgi:hypothetical protein